MPHQLILSTLQIFFLCEKYKNIPGNFGRKDPVGNESWAISHDVICGKYMELKRQEQIMKFAPHHELGVNTPKLQAAQYCCICIAGFGKWGYSHDSCMPSMYFGNPTFKWRPTGYLKTFHPTMKRLLLRQTHPLWVSWSNIKFITLPEKAEAWKTFMSFLGGRWFRFGSFSFMLKWSQKILPLSLDVTSQASQRASWKQLVDLC